MQRRSSYYSWRSHTRGSMHLAAKTHWHRGAGTIAQNSVVSHHHHKPPTYYDTVHTAHHTERYYTEADSMPRDKEDAASRCNAMCGLLDESCLGSHGCRRSHCSELGSANYYCLTQVSREEICNGCWMRTVTFELWTLCPTDLS